MYQLKGSLCLGRTIGAQWQSPDLENIFMYSVLSEFKNIFLVVTHPAADGDIYVDLNELRTEVSGYAFSVGRWLVDIGDRALPTVESLPNGELRYAKYGNARQANYHLSFALAGLNYQSEVSNASFPDIKITRPSVSTPMRTMDTHCLVSVNGFVHTTLSNDTETFIINGGITSRRVGESHVGSWSFLDIGKLDKVRIRAENIQPLEINTSLYQKLRFTVDCNLTNKSVMLVLGGYVNFVHPESFYQIGEKTFAVDLKRMQYEDRVMHSRNQIDLTYLELSEIDGSPNHVDKEQLRSDTVIRKYFDLSQSFLVVVDTPQLFVNRIPVIRAAFPGQYLYHENPVYPLQGTFGKFFEYWKRNEGDKWSLGTRDAYYKKFMFHEGAMKEPFHVSDALDPTYPFDHVYGRLLEVSGTPQ